MDALTIVDPNPKSAPLGKTDTTASRGRYAFVSLGCPKNLVDSERMLGLLQLNGYELVADPEGTDFVVVNTCGFIESARDESYATVREMLDLKRQGQTSGVIVTGCLAEKQKESLLAEYPAIDHLVGVFGRDEITKVADRLVGDLAEQRSLFRPAPAKPLSDRHRMRITPRHYAYLKISEGCDRLCTFCAIPRMRGKHASKLIGEVVAEAQDLAADGARELIIVAQDTTYYGMDHYGRPRLNDLLRELDRIDGIEWIRLMYLYPMYITDELLETIASSQRILPYLDLPLQHINDKILKRMQRRVTRREIEHLLQKLAEWLPDLVLRTTFITGFPGESDEQFEELLDFVNQGWFQRLGAFTYSYEQETPSAKIPGHLPESIKAQRRDALMQAQQKVAFAWNRQQIGQSRDVLLDQPIPGQDGAWIGRSHADAPDVDCSVYVTGGGLRPGAIVPCEFVSSQDYDLIGAAVGAPR